LAITQGVKQSALRFLSVDSEGQIEGAACSDDAQVLVENQQWLAHGINDSLCKSVPIYEIIEWHHRTP
jgi:hypothetical protein